MERSKPFGEYKGEACRLYEISDGNLKVGITDFGARITYIEVSGVDVALGFDSVDGYAKGSGLYMGATIGRVANRIARGVFTLGGKRYSLVCNEGKNHLHGGCDGFNKKIFSVIDVSANSITLACKSADGEQGYPAALDMTVKYTVRDDSLSIDYEGVSDGDTLWSPTGHAYFNLDGAGRCDCLENILSINANEYTPIDGELIPIGESRDVRGTVFDFCSPKKIGHDFGDVALAETNGYDHNYVLSGECAACVRSEKTGITMRLYTDMPCMQFYSGGVLERCNGRSGVYGKWYGFCLEPQYAPDAINKNGFSAPVLEAFRKKTHFIRYEFGCNN